MLRYKLNDFFRGWFIGNFEPTILKTDQFEVGVLTHKKGEYWAPHIHKESIEYNLLLEGLMFIMGKPTPDQFEIIKPGDIFVFEKGEVAEPIFCEDCKVLVIKVPSIPGDKYNVV